MTAPNDDTDGPAEAGEDIPLDSLSSTRPRCC